MLWGWRDYMPTFTEASLIAAGTGALLWAVLAAGATPRRRTITGLATWRPASCPLDPVTATSQP